MAFVVLLWGEPDASDVALARHPWPADKPLHILESGEGDVRTWKSRAAATRWARANALDAFEVVELKTKDG